MELAPVTAWQKQPERETVVWQHNSLAEARYELTAREQKLLLYVIAMIEPEDEDFKRYVVNIAEFAELAGLDAHNLYRELRDLAKSLKQKPLIIRGDYFFTPRTASFAALAMRNLTTVLAGIVIFCCVFGLKPTRAFLFCFTSLPNPGKTNSPFFLMALYARLLSVSRNTPAVLLFVSVAAARAT